ncbi:hypothetical protein CVT26_009729 [Gymnopilus dilepis]|uniref:DNA2/NAM7 helicase helicase domain-containing protein n=1 Tax=Gymnopilus dilepis TaxID=231916 RepID=A0A409WCT4_9AGAR|nr:hypothetical protein CVT26_009729 [Gymnopilus dilepis]
MGSITATNLATYQHLSCELYIHRAYQSPRSDGPTTFVSQKHSQNPTQSKVPKLTESVKAELRRGVEWEQRLLSYLDREGLLLRIPHIPVTGNTLLENIAADERSHFFISGVSFLPPNEELKTSFQQYGSHPIRFGLAKPDLIEIKRVDNRLKWRVLDAKASKHVKPSHHIQIYFYTLCLNHILHRPIFMGTDQPAVWLPPYNRPQATASFDDIHAISLSLLDASFRPILFRDLPRIIYSTPDDLDWHFNASCRDCQYQATCESTVVQEGLLNNISNISREDVQILKQLLNIARREASPTPADILPDIEELHRIFAEPHRREAMRNLFQRPRDNFDASIHVENSEGEHIRNICDLPATKSERSKAIPRFNYSCPSDEDIAVVITAFDPRTSLSSSNHLYCISVHASVIESMSRLCTPATFIQELADIIRRIDACRQAGQKPTCQFYTWSVAEHAHLQSLLASEGPSHQEDDRQTCLQVLAQGTATMESKHYPRVLQKVLTNFLKRASRLDCRVLCDCLGIPNQGSREMLEKRIDERITIMRTEHEISKQEPGVRAVGQLAPMVVLKAEIERHLVLPIPGSWDLHEYMVNLLPESSTGCSIEEILRAHHKGDTQSVEESLRRRNDTIYSVLKDFRNRARPASGGAYLINKATPLSLCNPVLCEEPHIRKLFTMQQLEVFSRLSLLWRSRIDQGDDKTMLVYRGTLERGSTDEHIFDVKQHNAKKYPFKESGPLPYNFILTRTTAEDGLDFPTEALFDDSAIADANPQAHSTVLPGWAQQDPRVRENILLGHVTRTSTRRIEGVDTLSLTIRTWGKNSLLSLGSTFRISPRLVDFNTPKILASLFETDIKWRALEKSEGRTPTSYHHNLPLLQLITNPTSLESPPTCDTETLLQTAQSIQRTMVAIAESGVSTADALVLKPSQLRAVDSVLRNRLSVIWGPPGTGKTHTIALSLLRLLEVEHPKWGNSQYTIIITAVTHTAILECHNKLTSLIQGYRSSRSSGLDWIEDIDIQVIDGLINRSANSRRRARIWLGTIYQVSVKRLRLRI